MALIITPRQLKVRAEFYREMAALLGAGVPALQALQQIIRHPPSSDYRRRLTRVRQRVEAGSTLSEALRCESFWLPELDLALLEAGERSGRLVDTCRSLSSQYTERARLIDGFIAKLIYPVLLFHLAVLVFPPDLLPGLVWRGEVRPFVLQKIGVLGPVYIGVILFIVGLQSRRLPGWQSFLESVLHSIPGLGAARRELALARLASTLEALISAGVGIVEAWELAAVASGSPALRRNVMRWHAHLIAGEPPSEHLARNRFFPEVFSNLYSTGELSGKLDQELRHLHAYYQESGTRKLERFSLVLSLLILLGVVGAIAFSIIQFWIRYYNQMFETIGI
jgi:type II secretory pathway component PulF